MDRLEIAEDRSTVTIGPGLSWGDVYERIVPESLVVGGGRVSTVGVPGLVLGGELFENVRGKLEILNGGVKAASRSFRHGSALSAILLNDSR